jgi:hypothetical protein
MIEATRVFGGVAGGSQARRRIKAQQRSSPAAAWDAVNAMDHGRELRWELGSWAGDLAPSLDRWQRRCLQSHAPSTSQPAAISESTAPTDARRRPRLLTPPAHDLTTARDGSLGPLTLTSSSHGANDGLDAAHPVQHPLPHPLPHPHSALHTPTAPLLLLPAEPR